MAVLTMVVQGMVEETLDENDNTIYLYGTINAYLSSKLDGIRATLLNLPYASLGYIPWVMALINSPTGPQPHPADPWGIFVWLITWLIPILHAIIIIVTMLASDSTGFIVNFATSIFMKLMTALGNLLWVIIRAAILVFAWIIFAITLPFVVIGFLTSIATINCILMFSNLESSITISSYTIYTETFALTIGYECNLVYIEFFDIEVPNINAFCMKDDQIFMKTPYNICNVGFNSINKDDFEALVNSTSYSNQVNSYAETAVTNYLSGCGATMAAMGTYIGLLAAIWAGLNEFKDCWLLLASWAVGNAALLLFWISLINAFESGTLGWAIAGIGMGLLISSAFGFLMAASSNSKWNLLSYISLGFSTFSLVLSFVELINPDYALGVEISQIVLGIISLICGTLAATYLTGSSKNKKELLGISIWLGGGFCGIGLLVLGLIYGFLKI